jgi:hypothetical protein
MKIIGANVTGSFILNSQDVTTTIQTSNVWSGSVATDITALNASTASLNRATSSLNAATSSLLNYTASNNAAISDILLETASFNAFSSSILNYTASTTTAIADILLETASFNVFSASILNYTASTNGAISDILLETASINNFTASLLNFSASQKTLNGTLATTGSNIFYGTQTITGSLFIANNLVVQGSSSLQNITASAVSIGTNTVILNTDTPAVRFGGIKVQDSGSGAGASGSLFWDSLNNHWIYQHPTGGAESGMSARLISGPKNSGSLGNEAGITSGKITVAVGDDHIGDSIMTQTGTVISVAGDLTATSLTGSINGSQITNSTVANAKLANSTISGISLGSNLATLTIGTGLSGTSYNGSTGITIACTITNNNQLTNGAGYITSAGSISGNAATATALSSGQSNWSGTGVLGNVVGLLAWKNYGNSHVIFDASNGTSPSGGAVNNTNAQVAWTGTYPTIMGWNGGNTYGVRVDSARVSDNTSGNSATTSQTTFSTLTSTGAITANNGGSYSATLGTIASSWAGNSTYPTLYGSTVDRWVMHMNMHISYTANGVNGFGGSMTGATIRMASDTAATHYWDIGPGTSGVGTDKFSIGRNATSLFSITSGGIIGINTASPLNTAWGNDTTTKQLSMYGSGYAVINLEGANGGTTRKFSMGVGDNRFYMCYDNTAARHNLTINSDGLATFGGAITAVGDITAFSDFRLKENVLTITNPLSKVMSLRGVTYNRTDLEDKSTKIGFIAQDVKEVIPEVVTYNEEQDKYGVSYGNVTALLVEAIKEQQTQIEELKSIINALTK